MQEALLRIFVGEADRVEGKPLYEWLVLEAKARKLAGATVFRGLMGFGAKSHMHTFKIERLSLDLPILIEIVDRRDRLEDFLTSVRPHLSEGIATLENVDVIHFGPAAGAARAADG